MQRLFRPLSLSLLLTVSLPAFGQASEGTPGSLPERVRPLKLSLPRDDPRPIVWSSRTGPDGVSQENPQPAEDVRPDPVVKISGHGAMRVPVCPTVPGLRRDSAAVRVVAAWGEVGNFALSFLIFL